MTIYKSTIPEMIDAANKAAEENPGTILVRGSYFCPCGESHAIRMHDEKTGNILEVFVKCELCSSKS